MRAEDLTAEFIGKACLSYGNDDWPQKWRRAERIRVRHPEIARANVYTACVAGELDHVHALLAADPSLAARPGGPQGWLPLLFVCYGRLPHAPAADNAVSIAELLLDYGADPNCFFQPENQWRFTAITGAIGKGELGQPPHPRGRALVELLLSRGADPNDGQGLYNDMLIDDDDGWLRLLIAHGLGPNSAPKSVGAPHRMLDYLLLHAAEANHPKRVACLLSHGADPNVVDSSSGKSAYVCALLAGNVAIAEELRRHGAPPRDLVGPDAFIAASMRGDTEAARALVAAAPAHADAVDPLIDAAGWGRIETVRLLLDVGVNPNGVGKHDKRPLHVATGHPDVALLLLDHGADPRERVYGGTAAHWALTAGKVGLARHIAERSRTPHDATRSGHIALLAELLAGDPAAARTVDENGDTPLHVLPEGLDEAAGALSLLVRHGADRAAVNAQGMTPSQSAEARGLDELADLIETGA